MLPNAMRTRSSLSRFALGWTPSSCSTGEASTSASWPRSPQPLLTPRIGCWGPTLWNTSSPHRQHGPQPTPGFRAGRPPKHPIGSDPTEREKERTSGPHPPKTTTSRSVASEYRPNTSSASPIRATSGRARAQRARIWANIMSRIHRVPWLHRADTRRLHERSYESERRGPNLAQALPSFGQLRPISAEFARDRPSLGRLRPRRDEVSWYVARKQPRARNAPKYAPNRLRATFGLNLCLLGPNSAESDQCLAGAGRFSAKMAVLGQPLVKCCGPNRICRARVWTRAGASGVV